MLYYRKKVKKYRGKWIIFLDDPPVFYSDLKLDDLLDVNDLVEKFKVSSRQVYRWIKDKSLQPNKIIGLKYFFLKKDVDHFSKTKRPSGRPRKS